MRRFHALVAEGTKCLQEAAPLGGGLVLSRFDGSQYRYPDGPGDLVPTAQAIVTFGPHQDDNDRYQQAGKQTHATVLEGTAEERRRPSHGCRLDYGLPTQHQGAGAS